jgi:F0F1-type ATP synthase membrane subunit b/b'
MTPHDSPHHPSIGDLGLPTVNFVLFVALMIYFLRAPLREYFRDRTERLRNALAAGERARHEAAELRAAIARDVADLPALRDRLRADLRAAAEQQRTAIIELGRRGAERTRADARLLAEQEATAAREGLRAEVIEEAVRQATAVVRAAIQPDDQDRFLREFVAGAGAGS